MKYLLNEISLKEEENNDIILNKINKFCKNKIDSEKCQKFYKSVLEKEDGIHLCPYGFNCIKKNKKIYNSLLIKGKYNKSKIKKKKDPEQYIFTENTIMSLIDTDDQNNNNLMNYENTSKSITDFLHDVTKANQLIEKNCSTISKSKLVRKDKAKLESIIHLSDFIKKRIDLNRYISNPQIITIGSKRCREAYKLWDIYRHIFNEMGNISKISIDMHIYNMEGELSPSEKTNFFANDSITILPFLLVDNAIKYSAENSIVKVCFYQENGNLKKMVMSSTPSYIIAEDVNLFFNRGYRSEKNTSKSSGSGLGLNIVKQICDYNQIDINLSIGVDEEGKQMFCIEMRFNEDI